MRLDLHDVVLALVAAGVMTVSASGDFKTTDVAEVPVAVRQAADKAAPGCTWTTAVTLTRNSRPSAVKGREKKYNIYRLNGKNREGRESEALLTARGTVLESKTQIPMDDVPKKVADAFKAKPRDFKPISVGAIALSGEIVWYEFEGKNSLGKEVVILVSADGATVQEWDEDNAIDGKRRLKSKQQGWAPGWPGRRLAVSLQCQRKTMGKGVLLCSCPEKCLDRRIAIGLRGIAREPRLPF